MFRRFIQHIPVRIIPSITRRSLASSSLPFYKNVSFGNEWNSGSSSNQGRHRNHKFIVYSSILALFGLEKDKSDENEIILTIKRAVLLYNNGDFKKSEQMLHIALRTAQQLQNEKGITYIYDLLGNLALEQEQYDKAEKLLIAVMQRLLADGVSNNDVRNVCISGKLARLYHMKGDFEKAGIGFRWTLKELDEIIKNSKDQNLKDFSGLVKIWYGRLLLDQDSKLEALEILTEAYEIMNENEENIYLQVLLLNDIATIYEGNDDLLNAEKSMTEAIRKAKTIKYPDLCVLFLNAGRILIRLNMYERARKHCGMSFRLAFEKENEACQKEALKCSKEAEKLFKEENKRKK